MFLWPVLSSCITIFLEENHFVVQNFFISILIFLAIPSIYLSIRAKKYVPKAIIASLIGSIPLMIVVEYFGNISQAWTFPSSVFPFTLFGIVIIEVLFWAFFNVYFVVIFYEYFLNKHVTKHLWQPRMKYLVWGLFILFLIFLFIVYNLSIIAIPYFYFIFGIFVFGLPVFLQLYSYSKTKKATIKILKAVAYFFYLSFTYEIVALHYGWWGFPENTKFVGYFSIINFTFPLEELVWWILLFAFAVLSCYEFFDDDEK